MISRSMVALLLLVGTLVARAGLIYVDFSTGSGLYSGLGIAPGAGTFWNAGSLNTSGLLEADGLTASGISYTSTFTTGFTNGGNALLGDRLIFPSGGVGVGAQGFVTLSGFAPGEFVDLYLYNGFYAQRYSAPSAGTADVIPDPSSYVRTVSSWAEGREYGFLENAQADGSGNLQVSITALNGYPFDDGPTISGLQIVSKGTTASVIPEPSPFGLLFLLTFLVFLTRRSSRRIRAPVMSK